MHFESWLILILQGRTGRVEGQGYWMRNCVVVVGWKLTWGYRRFQRRALALERRRGGGRLGSPNIQSGEGIRCILDTVSAIPKTTHRKTYGG